MSRTWVRVPLTELLVPKKRTVAVDPATEYNLVGAHWYAKGLYVKETKVGAEIRASKLFCVCAGDFVYNRLFAWKGSFAIASEQVDRCYVSNEFPCFEVNRSRIDPDYLWMYFSRQSAWNEALGLSFGATPTSRNRLKEARLLSIKIPLPPLPEQRRIVGKIDQIAKRIREAKNLRQQTSEETRSIGKASVAEVLGSTDPRFSKPIGGCCQLANGRPFKPYEWSDHGLPIIRIQNLNDETAPFNYCAFDVADRFLIEHNDLLLSWSGTPGTSFGAHIWKRGRAVLNQHIFKVILNESAILKPFFRYTVNYKVDEMISQAHGGVGLQHITKGKLEQIQIPVPPMQEQRRIVAYLDNLQAKLDSLKQLQDQTAAELDALLPSILDKAFRGEL